MPDPFLHLIIQYCNHPMPERQAEFDYCVRRNLANPHVKAVHNLVEPKTTVPQEFTTNPKYREHKVEKWLTYRTALAYANEHLTAEIACIVNLDIFLDAKTTPWEKAAAFLRESVVLCLSRVEFRADGTTFLDPGFTRVAFANSQDAWLFQVPLEVPDCDFEIGILGCDNAFAERVKRAGLIPVNVGGRFQVLHFDRCRGKTAYNQSKVHKAEQGGAERIKKRPEDEGQYPLPDFDQVSSLDAVVAGLKLTPLQRYTLICDTLARFRKINNRDPDRPVSPEP